mgnify:CR=1 FL=1
MANRLLTRRGQPQQPTEEGEEDCKFGAGETIAIPDRFEQVAVEGVAAQILKGQLFRKRKQLRQFLCQFAQAFGPARVDWLQRGKKVQQVGEKQLW